MSAATTSTKRRQPAATAEYCAELQRWMWQYYCGYASWHCWLSLSAFPPTPPGTPASTCGGGHRAADARSWGGYIHPLSPPAPPSYPGGGQRSGVTPDPRPAPDQRDGAPQAGREYNIPSPLLRLLAETVDFFILFCVKATIVLWIMQLSGMKDLAKIITHFVVEEIDENTSMEDLQKMMAVALVYRLLVCVYEIICVWGAGGATPGKLLLGLQVVTCDTSTLVQPNRVSVVPASNVSLSSSTVRALCKNFSITFLFPVFIPLLFFQHNRTVYDVAAGTIVVQRTGGR